MRSFVSALFFGLLLSLVSLPNGVVDARIRTPFDANAIKVEPNAKDQPQRSVFENSALLDTVNGVRMLLQGSHRSLGGGVENSPVSFPKFQRSLVQQQSWARDDEGKILWWIWLIIGLCCGLCCVVCCCASACCLRD